MSTIKNINIKTGESTYDSRDIGAEAEYVDVSRKADGTIIVDLDTETVASTESLAQTLKDIEDLDTVPTQNSTKGITSGAVYTATLADSALSPSSIKPVQNKIVTNALNEKVKRTVISSDVETIGSASVGSYDEGQIFIATNGNAYKALEDIDAGDTLVENTNCEQTTLSDELKSLDLQFDTTPIEGSNHPVTSDGIYNAVTSLNEALTKQILYFTSVACAATTGNFATVSNANISADHVVVECTFANPSAITTDVSWTTANGSLTLNGTCASATTANITLSKKGN